MAALRESADTVPLVPLGELCRIVGGGTPSKKEPTYYQGIIPWVTVKDFTEFNIVDTVGHITDEAVSVSATNVIPADTVLVVTRVGLGKVAMTTRDMAINQDIKALFPDDRLLPEYLFWNLVSQANEIQRMGVGATVKGITLPQLKSLSVPLPSHNEQRRIVDILKRADGIRRLRKQAQDTARQLIPALFIEMFGDPVANPKEWVTKPLQELLLSIDSGWSPKCDNQSAAKHEWGVLKLSAVTYGEFIEQENKALPAGIDPKLALEVHAGDVLFTRKNTKRLIAATVLVKQTRPNLMLSDLIFRLRIADDNVLLPEYLWALLSNPIKRSEIQNLATGAASSMPNISKKKLMTVEIPIAPAGLQKAFATSLENIHSVFGQQKMAGLAAESAFQSLLYRCFSGSVD